MESTHGVKNSFHAFAGTAIPTLNESQEVEIAKPEARLRIPSNSNRGRFTDPGNSGGRRSEFAGDPKASESEYQPGRRLWDRCDRDEFENAWAIIQ